MRQFVLVVLLVAAAFAGGAVVNGPGMRWVQARLLDYLGLKDEGEIASIDPPRLPEDVPDARRTVPGSGSEAASKPVAGDPPARSGPRDQGAVSESASTASTPAPPPASGGLGRLVGQLVGVVAASSQGSRTDATTTGPAARPATPASPAQPIPAAVSEPAAREAKASPPPSAEASPPPEAGPPPAPLDPEIGEALLASHSAAAGRPAAPADGSQGAPLTLELAPSPAPPAGSAPPSQAVKDPSPSPPAPSPAISEDWMNIRRKLQSLGVRRYTIDGEPGGRVRFSCLVPLAGRQAVSQHFEAQGDDEAQAARAVIRRITLWRATRSALPPAP